VTRRLSCVGFNHKTAPVELRECIAFSEEAAADALDRFRRSPEIEEVMLISTCNRVELLMVTAEPDLALEKAKAFLAESNRVPVERFEPALYRLEGDDAVRHVFRVSASLDSMVIGEPQILGQVKGAYSLATRQKTSGVILNRLRFPPDSRERRSVGRSFRTASPRPTSSSAPPDPPGSS